jgi:hypothetical protein
MRTLDADAALTDVLNKLASFSRGQGSDGPGERGTPASITGDLATCLRLVAGELSVISAPSTSQRNEDDVSHLTRYLNAAAYREALQVTVLDEMVHQLVWKSCDHEGVLLGTDVGQRCAARVTAVSADQTPLSSQVAGLAEAWDVLDCKVQHTNRARYGVLLCSFDPTVMRLCRLERLSSQPSMTCLDEWKLHLPVCSAHPDRAKRLGVASSSSET